MQRMYANTNKKLTPHELRSQFGGAFILPQAAFGLPVQNGSVYHSAGSFLCPISLL